MRCSLRRVVLVVAGVVIVQLALNLLVLPWRQRARASRKTDFVHRRPPCNFSKGCNPTKEGLLNVHIIPHSHTDVGWVKTLEEYYTGISKNGEVSQCVRCTLDTAVQELLQDPRRRFIFMEMAFLSRWWREQTPDLQREVRQLVDQGRLQLVIGGWCMSDGATPYYNDVIDLHALGFDFIQQEFGRCAHSHVAWHVDQFGHSRELASLLAQMGFDALILGRIDVQDYEERKKTKTMEMVWKASPKNLGDVANIFTHISYDGYYAPKGFVMDNWNNQGNVLTDDQVSAFKSIVLERAASFRTKHLMMPMGSDFGYRNAKEWFSNLDTLIDKINRQQAGGSQVNLLYSTPGCYVEAVQAEEKVWGVKEDDFLPYMIEPANYWTGYFTSKPALKRHVKLASATLQACKQLAAFSRLKDAFNRTQILREAVAVMQHHDAITGTEKDYVTKDYNRMLSAGEKACESVIGDAYRALLKSDSDAVSRIELCPLLNISECTITERSSAFSVLAYNPLPHAVVTWLRLPVMTAKLRLYDWEGKEQPLELVPVTPATMALPGRTSVSRFEAVFPASLPALGYTTFTLKLQTDSFKPDLAELAPVLRPYVFRNKHLELTLDTATGLVSKLRKLDSGVEVPLTQDFAFYRGSTAFRASGAYLFHPADHKTMRVGGNKPVEVKVFQGEAVQEIHQVFCDYVTQVIRLYDDAEHVELEWTVGPLPDKDDSGEGTEVVSYFNTNLKSRGIFYTDSHGREIMQRRRDHRDTWKLRVADPVSGNFYPVTSRIFLTDKERNIQMTVMTDRCQGGASIFDGSLELMVHRRLFLDDGLGVDEALNERGEDGRGLIVRGKHFLYVDTIENSARFHREMALRLNFAPTLAFTPTPLLSPQASTQKSFLNAPLPPNVHLLTLDQSRDGDISHYVIRLEHVFERLEDVQLSDPVSVDLEELFTPFTVQQVEELSLGANFLIDDVRRLSWRSSDGTDTPASLRLPHPGDGPAAAAGNDAPDKETPPPAQPVLDAPFSVSLLPMQIRTFRIVVVQSQSSILRFLPKFF